MKLCIRRSLVALGISALLAAPTMAAPGLVVLVRHAEKEEATGADPALSEAGKQRARDLADALSHAGITGIITTQYQRTRQTAAPLALRLGIKPLTVEAGAPAADHVVDVVAALRAQAGNVLVVGHSNTVTRILGALGGPVFMDLCESSFSHAFVLDLSAQPTRLLRLRYGAVDTPPAEGCL